jgi:hypothetical protein
LRLSVPRRAICQKSAGTFTTKARDFLSWAKDAWAVKALAMTAAAIAIRAVLLLIIAFPRLFIANLFSFRWPVGSRNTGHPPYDISPKLGPPRHPISDYKPTFSQGIIST